MRPRVEGMNAVDDAILEFYQEQEGSIVLPPKIVWYNLHEVRKVIDKTAETVRRRMKKLARRGLLERVEEDRAYYRLTQKGRDYLTGDIEAGDLRLDDEQ